MARTKIDWCINPDGTPGYDHINCCCMYSYCKADYEEDFYDDDDPYDYINEDFE